MDERYDMVRVVRDKRYIYIRNYMPHKIYGQYISYMFKTPTTQVWHDLYHAGKLNAAQSHFWKTKPAEELYANPRFDSLGLGFSGIDFQNVLDRRLGRIQE